MRLGPGPGILPHTGAYSGGGVSRSVGELPRSRHCFVPSVASLCAVGRNLPTLPSCVLIRSHVSDNLRGSNLWQPLAGHCTDLLLMSFRLPHLPLLSFRVVLVALSTARICLQTRRCEVVASPVPNAVTLRGRTFSGIFRECQDGENTEATPMGL